MKFLLLIVAVFGAALAEESDVLKEFAAGNVQYVGNLYKELLKEHPGNFLVCPLSIQTVFALVNGGAKGNTAKQITQSLRLPEGKEKVKETFLRLVESLQANDKYTLSSANKVYVADHFRISDEYKSTAVDVFHSEIQNIDFGKTQQAVDEINKWVEDKTHEKIKNLLSTDMVDASTVAVLVNALYFQGKWVTQFEKVVTALFHINKKETVPTNLMKVTSEFNYYDSEELKAKFLELPYKGEEISMVVVLPHDVEGLAALEGRIDEVLTAPQLKPELVEAYIPKFKIETKTELIPVLIRMGIVDAFRGSADFTGIGESGDHLMITEVIQKAFIEVDEKGTTAAAATAISMSRSSRRREEIPFNADHPFLFYLKHRVNGIFFVGRYSAPEADSAN